MNLNALTLRNVGSTLRLIARKLRRRMLAPPPTPPPLRRDLIDVRELIRTSPIDELNRKAEEYFAHLEDWNSLLSKPFSNADDTPALLANFATAIHGLRLFPGARVLDFGSGTGWTSRFLTQLGCSVVLLDVSKTALEIARELFRTHPVIGPHAEPEYVPFDGISIPLPEASVDRILCFDSFHHVPDPGAMIAEFARVLRPGGLAVFSEPGPEHSKTEQSQSEMREFGVIENDIDIHAVWEAARAAGFVEIRLALSFPALYQVDLPSFDEVLAGGPAYLEWAEMTRAVNANIRNFVLKIAGEEPVDSRKRRGLSAGVEVVVPPSVAPGLPVAVEATVRNDGSALWLPSGTAPGGVSLGCHLCDPSGKIVANDFHWQRLTDPPRPLAPGESVSLRFELPPLERGSWLLEFDCVADRVTWFGQVGSRTARVPIEVG